MQATSPRLKQRKITTKIKTDQKNQEQNSDIKTEYRNAEKSHEKCVASFRRVKYSKDKKTQGDFNEI